MAWQRALVVALVFLLFEEVSAESQTCEKKKPGFFGAVTSLIHEPVAWADSYNAGFKNYQETKYSEALQNFKSALTTAKDKPDFRIYYNLGNTYFRLYDFSSAEEYFQKAVAMNPEDPDAQWNLSVAKAKVEQERKQLIKLFDGIQDSPIQMIRDGSFVPPQVSTSQTEVSKLLASIADPKLRGEIEKRFQGLDQKDPKTRKRISESLEQLSAELIPEANKAKVRIDRAQKETAQKNRAMAKASRASKEILERSEQWEAAKPNPSQEESMTQKKEVVTGTPDLHRDSEIASHADEKPGEIFQKIANFSVEPEDSGLLYNEIFDSYDASTETWASPKRKLTPYRLRSFQEGPGPKILGKINSSLIPLLNKNSYAVDPDSFRFEKPPKAWALVQDSVGITYLSIQGEKGSKFRYEIRALKEPYKNSPPAQTPNQAANIPAALKQKFDPAVAGLTKPLEKARAIEAIITREGLYTKEDDAVDSFLKHSGKKSSVQMDRMSQIFFQENLPESLKGKGMNCNSWSSLFLGIARHYGLSVRMMSGYQSPPGVLTMNEPHAWVEVWDPESARWVPLNPTPSNPDVNSQHKLREQLAKINEKREALIKVVQALAKLDQLKEKEKEPERKPVKDPALKAMYLRSKLQANLEKWKQELDDRIKYSNSDEGRKTFEEFIKLSMQEWNSPLLPIGVTAEPEIKRELIENRLAQIEILSPYLDAQKGTQMEAILEDLSEAYKKLQGHDPLYKTLAEQPDHHAVLMNDRVYMKDRGSFVLRDMKVDRVNELKFFKISPDGKSYAASNFVVTYLVRYGTVTSWAQGDSLDSSCGFSKNGDFFHFRVNNNNLTVDYKMNGGPFYTEADWPKLIQAVGDMGPLIKSKHALFDKTGRIFDIQEGESLDVFTVLPDMAVFFTKNDNNPTKKVFFKYQNQKVTPLSNLELVQILRSLPRPRSILQPEPPEIVHLISKDGQESVVLKQNSDSNFDLIKNGKTLLHIDLPSGTSRRPTLTADSKLKNIITVRSPKREVTQLFWNGDLLEPDAQALDPKINENSYFTSFDWGDKYHLTLTHDFTTEKDIEDLKLKLILPKESFLKKSAELLKSTLSPKTFAFIARNFLHHTNDRPVGAEMQPLILFFSNHLAELPDLIADLNPQEKMDFLRKVLDQTIDMPGVKTHYQAFANALVTHHLDKDFEKILRPPDAFVPINDAWPAKKAVLEAILQIRQQKRNPKQVKAY
jgi:tetratricopeptide (TPR) repeat protein/Ca2+-binding EF-hand superfamily protein